MSQAMIGNSPPLSIHVPVKQIKLDLACGQCPVCEGVKFPDGIVPPHEDGFEGVDLYAPKAKHKFNLLKFPWPFADDSVDELFCSHFIEHIPMVYVSQDNGHSHVQDEVFSKDLLMAFFDECWRVLKDGGMLKVITPSARSDRAFQDPTHRRFIVAPTFCYLWKKWRTDNKLDHYNVKCDFDFSVDPSFLIQPQCCSYHMNAPIQGRHESVQGKEFMHYWNMMMDWTAKLIARKNR